MYTAVRGQILYGLKGYEKQQRESYFDFLEAPSAGFVHFNLTP